MSQAASSERMTAGDYLAWERTQRDRHEFHHGEVFAMSGASPRHNLIGASALVALHGGLRGRPCQVFTSDQRIAAPPGERYVYADAVAACGGARMQPGTSDVLVNPCIVVEVLSPSTEAYDRGAKWAAYQRIASLTDYLLVDQESARIEHYRRDQDGSWHYRLVEAGGTIELANGATLSVDAIYEGAFELPAG